MKKLNILFAASECTPFIKTGGLADVAGSLPSYVNTANYEMRIVMPKYSALPKKYVDKMEYMCNFYVPLGWRNQYCGLFKLKIGKVTYYFLDNEYYFHRGQLYGEFDDGERFAFFAKAVCEAILHMDFEPDILHCNDWHTALAPVFLREFYREPEKTRNIKTIFTIHNIKFQGMFSSVLLSDVLGLWGTPAAWQLLSDDHTVNYMLGALAYSDRITTVSPGYAEEICSWYYGEGLDFILRKRKDILSGILNGIDTKFYDPAKDDALVCNYDLESLDKKKENKLALQKETGLSVSEEVPMFSLISRLTEQKGLDLVTYILPHVCERNMQLVILGIGDAKYEEAFRYYADRHPDKIAFLPKFDEALSHRIYAASDAFLMPSRFEPCGLSQMMSMRYATLPIVRETGGLKDSVTPYNKYTGEGTGFSFANFNAHELLGAVDEALTLWFNDKKAWRHLMENAASADFSWKASAKEYRELYRNLV